MTQSSSGESVYLKIHERCSFHEDGFQGRGRNGPAESCASERFLCERRVNFCKSIPQLFEGRLRHERILVAAVRSHECWCRQRNVRIDGLEHVGVSIGVDSELYNVLIVRLRSHREEG